MFVLETKASVLFQTPLIDADLYDRAARALANEGFVEQDAFFFHSMGFPLVLSLLYKISNGSILLVKIVQSIVGAGTAGLTFLLAGKLIDFKTGIIAGLLAAFYFPMIFFDNAMLATAWATMLFTLLLWLLLLDSKAKTAAWMLGIVAGLAVLFRATLLPVALFALGYDAWRRTREYPETDTSMWLLSLPWLGFVFVCVPAAYWTYTQTEHFNFLPSGGGVNLFLGNNLKRCETLGMRPGLRWQLLVSEAYDHGVKDLWEQNSFFLRKTINYMLAHPFDAAVGWLEKLVQFISSRELPRTLDIYMFRPNSTLLSVFVWKVGNFGFPFSLVFLAAVAGWLTSSRRFGMPYWAFVGIYVLSVVIVFTSSRYRVPVTPLVLVASATGLSALPAYWKSHGTKHRTLTTTVLALACVASVLPGPFCQEQRNMRSEVAFLIGARFERQGDLEKATRGYEQALELQPEYFEAHHRLGQIKQKQNNPEQALQHFLKANSLFANYPPLLVDISRALGEQGKMQQAIEYLTVALDKDPDDVNALNNMGTALAMQGRLQQAKQLFEKAHRLAPDRADIEHNLSRTNSLLNSAMPSDDR